MKMDFSFKPAQISTERALALKAEIELFNAQYCATLDRGNIEDWPLFFVQDALYRVTSRENSDLNLPVGLVYAEGRDMMHDRAVAIARTQMYAPRYMLHLVTNVRVIDEAINGDIEAEANFMLMQTLVEGPSTVHLVGNYFDTFTRLGGKLLIKERQVIFDTAILANDLVFPV
ncbi:MAG TPA: aromatic-ring-hydroxylating dioxygenase subunit beta [Alcaligenes sp.]|nr:aromatic-ring-hydroxylating dioxygenase subunit beta [Alcaligenes sp.]HRL26691.1 aromatic-ring-hydroxylating dioxygenase subunit beta [Alcaligenes sp.]